MSGYTKIPNAILDQMAELSPAEFKLAMALYRMTVGCRRLRVRKSYTCLADATGLSRPYVLKCAAALVARGLFRMADDGVITEWVVNSVNLDGTDGELSLPDWLTQLTTDGKQSLPDGKLSLPPSSKEIPSHSAETVNGVKALAAHFEQETALTPTAANFNDDWLPYLEGWYERHGVEGGKQVISRAVAFARGKNDRGKRFVITSPRSLEKIAANLPENGSDGDKVIVGFR